MRAVKWIAPALLALLAAACLALVYLKQGVEPSLFFNSDASYLPALYHDLFERGGQLRAWFLTPAPYFFPDWPLYFGMRWLTGSEYHALAGVMAAQALLMWGLAALVLRHFAATANALAASALATVMVCLAAVNGLFPYTYVMLASYHFGTFLVLLAALALMLPLLRQTAPLSRGRLAGLAMLTALTVLSDRLYLMQFALPALALLVLMRGRLPQWRPLALALLAGCVAGMLLYKWKLLVPNSVSMPWHLAPRSTGANLQALLAMGGTVGQRYPLLALYCALYYAALLSLAPGTLLNRGWRLAETGAAWMNMLALAGAAGLLLVMAVSKAPPTERYLIPAFLLPVLLGPALAWSLAAQWRGGARQRHDGAGAALLLGGALLAWPLTQVVLRSGPVQQDYYPPQIACADRIFAQYDLRHGYAGYWDASWLAMNSRRKPVVAVTEGELLEQHWITTGGNFRPRYDFAVVAVDAADRERPSEALVVRRNGPPEAVAQCGTLKMLIYPRGGLKPLAPAR
jgi:hypothetical protein